MAAAPDGLRLSGTTPGEGRHAAALPPRSALHAFARRYVWAPHLLCALAMVFYGANYIVGRSVRDVLPPLGLVFWRAVIATLILLPIVWRPLIQALPVLRRHWLLLLGIALTQAVMGQALLFTALHTTSAINASLIASAQPVTIMLVAWAVLGERIDRVQAAGVVLALTGVLLVIARGDTGVLLELEFAPGDLLVAIAVLGWGFFAVFVKLAPEVDPFVLFVGFTAIGAVILLPLHLAEYAITGRGVEFSAEALTALFYTAVFGSILALGFLNTGIVHLGPGRSGIYHYLSPIVTALLAVPLLDEEFRWFHLGGLLLAATGVYLVNRRRSAAVSGR